jgi:hypothetical protein
MGTKGKKLATLEIVRTIHAPAAVVFDTVADPARFAEAISGVTKLEFLSSTKSGAGTRFRQSRLMNGKEMTLDFDIAEYVPNQRVRIVNEVTEQDGIRSSRSLLQPRSRHSPCAWIQKRVRLFRAC